MTDKPLVNLLDVLTADRTLPDGCDSWGVKSVHPDLRTRKNYRWPFPGSWAECDRRNITDHKGACPVIDGDGLCVGLTWKAMASGDIPARTLLLLAYHTSDVLGSDDEGKLRAFRVHVVDVVDGQRLIREHGQGADLRCADLRGMSLWGADLRGTNFWRADLRGADLRYADLQDAALRGANLKNADLNSAFNVPAGVTAS